MFDRMTICPTEDLLTLLRPPGKCQKYKDFRFFETGIATLPNIKHCGLCIDKLTIEGAIHHPQADGKCTCLQPGMLVNLVVIQEGKVVIR